MESQSEFERKLSGLYRHAIQLSKAEDIDEIVDCTADARADFAFGNE